MADFPGTVLLPDHTDRVKTRSLPETIAWVTAFLTENWGASFARATITISAGKIAVETHEALVSEQVLEGEPV